MQNLTNSTQKRLVETAGNRLSCSDVYSAHEYAQLYEEKENGEAKTVYFESPAGKVEYTFLKRKVPFQIDGKTYYDITTAYGYSGPCLADAGDPAALMAEFNESFSHYCRENDIVSEFVRFRLFESAAIRQYFPGEVCLIGDHIARNLLKPLETDLHKRIPASARKAERNGITVSFDTSGEQLDEFLSVYHQTMDRNHAASFYYFDRSFFEELHRKLAGKFVYAHAWKDGQVVASFSALYGNQYAYGFLGGTLSEYLKCGTSAYVQYELCKWLKENQLCSFILGGGFRGNDNLYKYKKKFDSEGSHPFYIGKLIHNDEVYQKLNRKRAAEGDFDPESPFFPLYRS